MIRICSNCKKVIGQKKPLDDKSETHTLCPECGQEMKREIDKYMEKKSQSLLSQVNTENSERK